MNSLTNTGGSVERERAGVSVDERAVWYLCEFYIPAVLTVNKGLVDGSISRAGSGLQGWGGGGAEGVGAVTREKNRGEW